MINELCLTTFIKDIYAYIYLFCYSNKKDLYLNIMLK